MKKWILLTSVIILISCNKRKISHLVGDWKYVTLNSLAPGSIVYEYYFIFKCDQSFSMDRVVSTSNPSNDLCHSYLYHEYAKGKYDVKNRKLELNGFFTDSLYNEKKSGCYSIGKYSETFKYRFEDENLIINEINDDADNEYILKRNWDYDCK